MSLKDKAQDADKSSGDVPEDVGRCGGAPVDYWKMRYRSAFVSNTFMC